MAVGAAATGHPVVLHMMFSNFIYAGFDGIANQMTKLPFMTGGQITLPITVLVRLWRRHLDRRRSIPTRPIRCSMNLGGINVVVPATPADAKGPAEVGDPQAIVPTVFFEARARGGEQGEVPDGRPPRAVRQSAHRAAGTRRHHRRDRRDGAARRCKRRRRWQRKRGSRPRSSIREPWCRST